MKIKRLTNKQINEIVKIFVGSLISNVSDPWGYEKFDVNDEDLNRIQQEQEKLSNKLLSGNNYFSEIKDIILYVRNKK